MHIWIYTGGSEQVIYIKVVYQMTDTLDTPFVPTLMTPLN